MQPNTLDIGSNNSYPAKDLCNSAARNFVFDSVEVTSLESLFQAFKFDKVNLQIEVCKMSGIKAKAKGKERNNLWKVKRGLWWNNDFYDRWGEDYQRLLDRIFISMITQEESYKKALLDTNDLILTNHTGKKSESETVITQNEFCSRLMKLRTLIRKGVDLSTLKRI